MISSYVGVGGSGAGTVTKSAYYDVSGAGVGKCGAPKSSEDVVPKLAESGDFAVPHASSEVDELKAQLAKARQFLNEISYKLQSLSMPNSVVEAGGGSQAAPISTMEFSEPAPVYYKKTIPAFGGKPSRKGDESVYVGFANDERLASSSSRHVYEPKQPDSQSSEVKFATEQISTLQLEPTVSAVSISAKKSEKKTTNFAGTSIYHARDLLNDYYA